MREACTHFCSLHFSLSVWVLLDVSFSFYGGEILTVFNSCSYSSNMAYLIDANKGRSSTALAANSAFRGVFAFIASEITVPMQVWAIF